MIIKSADFVISNTDPSKCPEGNLPEYAFIGRSNVGKSSLINMLTKREGLAKTSQTPGKTLLINHFLINRQWYLVDLPGYGYAQRSKKQRDELQRIIWSYIAQREQLTCLFVLIDSRHKPQAVDVEFINKLGEYGVPFSIVFTKLDKLGSNAGRENINSYKQHLLESWEELPPIFATSAKDKRGREELLDYIEQINASVASK